MKDFDIRKVANAIIFFLDNKVSYLTKTKFIKMMYFADKYHFENYGRSIFGDTYIKLPHGPIPTLSLSIINNDCDNADVKEYTDEFLKYVTPACTYNNITVFSKNTEFNHRIFSQSEIEALRKIAEEFSLDNADEISEKSHLTKAYQKASLYNVISEEDMAEDNGEYVSFWNNEFSNLESILAHR